MSLTHRCARWERLLSQQKRLDAALVDAWDAVLGEDYDAAIRHYSAALLMVADQRTLTKLVRDAQEERDMRDSQ